MAKQAANVQPLRTKSVRTSWLRNAMGALGSSTRAVLKEYSPNVSDAIASGASLAKSFRTSTRATGTQSNLTTRNIKQNKYVRIANSAFKNAINDIRAGNLAGNEERSQQAMEKSMGFDDLFADGGGGLTFGDEGGDNININYYGNESDGGMAQLSASVNRNAELTLKTSQAQMDAYVAISSATMQQTQEIASQVITHLSGIENNLASLVEYNNQNMNQFIEASMAYMERTGGALEKKEKEEPSATDPNRLLNSSGGLDIANYKKYVKARLKESLQGSQIGMVTSLLSDDILEQMAANPLGMVSTELVKVVMPEVLTTTIKGIEQTFTSMVPGLLRDLYNWGEQQRGGAFKQITGNIAKALGINVDRTSYLQKSDVRIERGAIPFDGETKHTITTIMTKELREQTTYLKYIAEHYGLKGKKRTDALQESNYFDYESNQFIKMKDLDQKILKGLQKSISDGFDNTQFGKAINRGILESGGNEAELKNLLNQFYNFIEQTDKNYDFSQQQIPQDIKDAIKGFSASNKGKKQFSQLLEGIAKNNPSVMQTLAQGQIRARTGRNKELRRIQEEYTTSGYLDTDLFERINEKTGQEYTIDELLNEYAKEQARKSRKSGNRYGSYTDVDMRTVMRSGNGINREAMELLDMLKGSSVRGLRNLGTAIMSGNAQNVYSAIGDSFGEMARQVSDTMNRTLFTPIRNAIFGETTENGFREGGMMSGATNAMRDMMLETAHQITGREYTDSSGEHHPKIDDSVMGQVKSALKEKFFGVENDDGTGIVTREGGILNYINNGIKDSFVNWHEAMFGKQDKHGVEVTRENVLKLMQTSIKEKAPNAIKGGLLGGTIGIASGGLLGAMVGGPLGGVLAGTAIGVASSGDKFKKWLFGDEDLDNGFISKKIQKYVKDRKNPLIAGAVLGGARGAITGGGILGTLVGGPMAGALLGMTTSMVAKSDTFHKFLFGDEKNGRLGVIGSFKSIVSRTKKENDAGLSLTGKAAGMAATGIAGGAITMAMVSKMGLLGSMLTPLGPVGGALIGLGLSIRSQSDTFRRWLFGDKKDKNDPEHKAGIIGQFGNMIQAKLLNPLKRTAADLAEDASFHFKHTILDTIEFAIEPIGLAAANIADHIKGRATKALNKIGGAVYTKVVDPIVKVAQDVVIVPFQKLTTGMTKLMYGVGKQILLAPFRLVDKTVRFMTSPVRKLFSAAFHPIRTAKRIIGKIEESIEKHTGISFEPLNEMMKSAVDMGKSAIKKALLSPFKAAGKIVGGAATAAGKTIGGIGDAAGSLGDRLNRGRMDKYQDGKYDEVLQKKYQKDLDKGKIPLDDEGNPLTFDEWRTSYLQKNYKERRKMADQQRKSDYGQLKHDRYERRIRTKNEQRILKETGMSQFEDTEANRAFVERKLGKKIRWGVEAIDAGRVRDSANLSDEELVRGDSSKMSNEVRQTSILQKILNVISGRNMDGSLRKKNKRDRRTDDEDYDGRPPSDSTLESGGSTENLGWLKDFLVSKGHLAEDLEKLDSKQLTDLFLKSGFDVTDLAGDAFKQFKDRNKDNPIFKNFFSMFTGDGYADGSTNTKAGISVVGEYRPELVMTQRGGKVFTDRNNAIRVFVDGISDSSIATIQRNGGLTNTDDMAKAVASAAEASIQASKLEETQETNAKLISTGLMSAKEKAQDYAVTAKEQLEAKKQSEKDKMVSDIHKGVLAIVENTKKSEEGESLFHKLWSSIFSKKGLITLSLLAAIPLLRKLLGSLGGSLASMASNIPGAIADTTSSTIEDATFHSENNATTNGKGGKKELEEGINDGGELLSGHPIEYLLNDEGNMDHRSLSKFRLLLNMARKTPKPVKKLAAKAAKAVGKGAKKGVRTLYSGGKKIFKSVIGSGTEGVDDALQTVDDRFLLPGATDDVVEAGAKNADNASGKGIKAFFSRFGKNGATKTASNATQSVGKTAVNATIDGMDDVVVKVTTETLDDVSETIAKRNGKLLSKVMGIIKSTLSKIVSKIASVLSKGGGKKAAKAATGAADEVGGLIAKVLAKHFPKISAKITAIIGGNAALAAFTSGVGWLIKEGLMITLSSINEVTGTERLFQVKKGEVDGVMRVIAAAIGAIKGTTAGSIMDVVSELVAAVTGVNIFNKFACLIYETICGEEKYDELREDQKEFDSDYLKQQEKEISESYEKLKKAGLLPEGDDGKPISEKEYLKRTRAGEDTGATYRSKEDYIDDEVGSVGSKMLKATFKGIKKIKSFLKKTKKALVGDESKIYVGKSGNYYQRNPDGTWNVFNENGDVLTTLDRKDQFESDLTGETIESKEKGLLEPVIDAGKTTWSAIKAGGKKGLKIGKEAINSAKEVAKSIPEKLGNTKDAVLSWGSDALKSINKKRKELQKDLISGTKKAFEFVFKADKKDGVYYLMDGSGEFYDASGVHYNIEGEEIGGDLKPSELTALIKGGMVREGSWVGKTGLGKAYDAQVEKLKTTVNELWNGAVKNGKDLLKTIKSKATDVKNKANDVIDYFSPTYSDVYVDTDGISYKKEGNGYTAYNIMGEAISKVGEYPAEEIERKVRSGLMLEGKMREKSEFRKDVESTIEDARSTIVNAFKTGWNTLKKNAKNTIDAAKTKATEIKDYATEFVEEEVYINPIDGSYFMKDGAGYTHYTISGEKISKVGGVDSETVKRQVKNGLFVTGSVHARTELRKDVDNAVAKYNEITGAIGKAFTDGANTVKTNVGNALQTALNKAKDIGQKAKNVYDDAKEYLIGEKTTGYIDASLSMYRANADGTYDKYNMFGERLTEGGQYSAEELDAMRESGVVREVADWRHFGMEEDVANIKEKIKGVGDTVSNFFSTNIQRAQDLVTSVGEKISAWHDKIGSNISSVYDAVKGIVSTSSTKAWYDGKGNYYVREGSGYAYYNLNGDKLKSEKAEKVDSMIESGLLTEGEIKRDSVAKQAISQIQSAAEDAWNTAKSTASAGWANFKKWLNGGSGTGTGTTSKIGGYGMHKLPSQVISMGGGFGSAPRGAEPDRVNDFPYYSQEDKRWANDSYSYNNDGGTMKNSGCGPAAMSMAITGVTGKSVDPRYLAEFAQQTGTRDETGTNWNFVNTSAGMFGLHTKQQYNPSSKFITQSLANGHPVVLSGASNGTGTPYTAAGHYIVAVGQDSAGNIKVNDPRGRGYSRSYRPEELTKYTGSAWEIGNGGYGSSWGIGGGYGKTTKKQTNESTTGIETDDKYKVTDADMLNNFPFLLQNDSRWGSVPYTSTGNNSQTIGNSGCGPTSMAEILRSYGANVTPVDTCKYAREHNFRTPNSGTDMAFFKSIASKFGLQAEHISIPDGNKVIEKLKAGIPLIAAMGPPTFTSGGHYIALSGITEDNKIKVNDPASKDRSMRTYPIDVFTRESNGGYEAISKNGKGSINNLATVGSISGTNTNSNTEATQTESGVSANSLDRVGSFMTEVGNRMANALFTNEFDTNFESFWKPVTTTTTTTTDTTTTSNATTTTNASSLEGNDVTEKVWKFLISPSGGGMTKEGAAGMMGNLEAESSINPGRVEQYCLDTYRKYGKTYTNESYTKGVDDGTISRDEFLHPIKPNWQFGYGLAQWTSPNRKAGLYDIVKSKKVSISDLGSQLEWLMKELQTSYSGVYNVLKTTNSVGTAAVKVLHDFENPRNASAQDGKRTSMSQNWYNKYAGTGGTGYGKLRKDSGLYRLIHGGFGLSKYFKIFKDDNWMKNAKFGGRGCTAAEAREALVNWMLCIIGRNTYTMGNARSQVMQGVDGHGYGDCSSTCCKIYETALGMVIGSYTDDMMTGTIIEKNESGKKGTLPDESKMLPGDLVFYFGQGGSGYGHYGHVEFYLGNGQLAGHGSGIGPKIHTIKDYTQNREGYSGTWGLVMRYVTDENASNINLREPDKSKMKVQNTFTDGKGNSANGANIASSTSSTSDASVTTGTTTTTSNKLERVSGFIGELGNRMANALFTNKFDTNFESYWNPVTTSDTTTITGSTTTDPNAIGSEYPKYTDISDAHKRDYATVITGETGGSSRLACLQEASQMVNLNEVTYHRPSNDASLYNTIHGGWYAGSSWGHGMTNTALQAVEEVMVQGKRVLPRYVTEHDMFPLDAAISGHWGNGKSEDRSQYVRHQTQIKQNPGRFSGGGATYTFYDFLGENRDGDVAGYYPSDYEKYKDDKPFGGGSGIGIGPKAINHAKAQENITQKLIKAKNLPQGDSPTIKSRAIVRKARLRRKGGYGDVVTNKVGILSSNRTKQAPTSLTSSYSNTTLMGIMQKASTVTSQEELLRYVIEVLAIIADNTGMSVNSLERANELLALARKNTGNKTVVVSNNNQQPPVIQTVATKQATTPSKNAALAKKIASGGI